MRLLIGVSGSVAAYKALQLARLAVMAGHAVRVIETASAERFVGRASFEAVTGAPVLVSEFERDPARGAYPGEVVADRVPISHLALAERADVFLIAPASANTIAKLACGGADNLLSAAALVARCPLLVAPAMNERMYLHPATQTNLATLQARGVVVIPPGEGALASHGEHGVGRLAEPEQLLAACEQHELDGTHNPGHSGRRLANLNVLVTAGGTQEPIDSVRFIGNRSSGRMGYEIAAAALRWGATVTLVSANVRLAPPASARVIAVRTAGELAGAVYDEAEHADVVVMAAAVADFRP
ncbi:MAG: bifunctional phosphopantothenoylcysteine decarboxylase/phosphopantothenate--cysteine ligase CoaBC, partial [Solirubrobacteraceae bacterium]